MKENIEKIHKYSFQNKKKLENVKKCGCGYCLKIFNTNEIGEWLNDKEDKTALCPYCGKDCIIPESTNQEYLLTEDLLRKINQEYF